MNIRWIYRSIQGDSWDNMSLSIYGDESLSYILLQANPRFMKYTILPAGLAIRVPELPDDKV